VVIPASPMSMMKRSLCRLTRRRIIQAVAAFAISDSLRLGGADAQTSDSISEQTHRPEVQAGAAAAWWLRLPPTPTLPDTTRSGITSVNGTSIFFAQFGSGPPVLLLHGGLANSNYWGHQVEHLAQKFLVTVIDTRGHGRSPVMSHSFSYRLFAEDVVGLLDFLKIPEVSIIGWSDGAITGLQLAMTKPDRVSKLFAFGANSSRDGLKANGPRSGVFPTYADRCKAEYALLSPHPERWAQLLGGLRVMWRKEPNFTKQNLAAVKAATTISDGEYDEMIKRDHTERMARAIPGARLVILPKVSHFAMLQNPVQFNKSVIEFLAT
jgi:pimeloyl-ACP methyl ester carboxylesterase